MGSGFRVWGSGLSLRERWAVVVKRPLRVRLSRPLNLQLLFFGGGDKSFWEGIGPLRPRSSGYSHFLFDISLSLRHKLSLSRSFALSLTLSGGKIILGG